MKKGQSVTITSDAIPGKTWKGRVAAVGLVPDQKSSAASGESTEQAVQYPFQVKLIGNLPEGKPGFKLIMNIETDKRKADTLPSSAVKKVDNHEEAKRRIASHACRAEESLCLMGQYREKDVSAAIESLESAQKTG